MITATATSAPVCIEVYTAAAAELPAVSTPWGNHDQALPDFTRLHVKIPQFAVSKCSALLLFIY